MWLGEERNHSRFFFGIPKMPSTYTNHFQTFAPSWPAASWLADFWFRLGVQLAMAPDHFFLQETMQIDCGPMRLDLINEAGGGIPREFLIALVNTMLRYTERGFCGMFNARVSNKANAGPEEIVKLWITFRIVDGLGQMIGT